MVAISKQGLLALFVWSLFFTMAFPPPFSPFTKLKKSHTSRGARFELQSVSLVDYVALKACTFIVGELSVTYSISREDIFALLHNSLVMAVRIAGHFRPACLLWCSLGSARRFECSSTGR